MTATSKKAAKLAAAAHEAAELRAFQVHPDVVALRIERLRTRVDRLIWTGLIFGLLFTMANVARFAAGDAKAPWATDDLNSSSQWVTAWLLDPMVSLVLVGVLIGEQVVRRYHLKAGGWVRITKWTCLSCTYAMNTWESWHAADPAAIVLHSVPVVTVFCAAEAVTTLRERISDAVERAHMLAVRRAAGLRAVEDDTAVPPLTLPGGLVDVDTVELDRPGVLGFVRKVRTALSRPEADEPTRTEADEPTRTAEPAPTRTEADEPSRTRRFRTAFKGVRARVTRTADAEPIRTDADEPTRTAEPEPTYTEMVLTTRTGRELTLPVEDEPSRTDEADEPTRTERAPMTEAERGEFVASLARQMDGAAMLGDLWTADVEALQARTGQSAEWVRAAVADAEALAYARWVPADPHGSETRTDEPPADTETRTDETEQARTAETEQARTAETEQARTAETEQTRTAEPIDRDAIVEALTSAAYQRLVIGERWTPKYKALMEQTGRGRSWCEKVAREARTAARAVIERQDAETIQAYDAEMGEADAGAVRS